MASIHVVDQNVMRRMDLDDFIARQPNAMFVIPDTGLVEMAKNEMWEETFRRNFEAFAPIVTRCFMSISVQEARDLEFKRGASAEGRLLPDDFTQLLRGAILGSQSSRGKTMSLLRNHMTDVQQDLAKHELNARANREELQGLVNMLRSELNESEIKACRQVGKPGRLARIGIAQSAGDALYVAHMKTVGMSVPTSRRLWKAKSMTRRWCYQSVHHALFWLGKGGLENAADSVVLNSILDQDYVLLGSFFDGVLSFETSVQETSEDLRMMLALPPSVNVPISQKLCHTQPSEGR